MFPALVSPAPEPTIAVPAPLHTASSRLHPQRLAIAGLSLLGAALTFLPWWSFFMVGTVDGTYGAYGWATLGLFALSLVAVLPGKPRGAPGRGRLLLSAGAGRAGWGAALFVGGQGQRELPPERISPGIVVTGLFTVGFGGDDRLGLQSTDELNEPVGIKRLSRNHQSRIEFPQQARGLADLMALPGGQT